MADHSGKIGIVTGSNSGIGFEAAKMLASGGMKIIMACRNEAKAIAACKEILNSYPGALVEYIGPGNFEITKKEWILPPTWRETSPGNLSRPSGPIR